MIYATLSDIHAHSWSLFAHTSTGGVNNRLRITLQEMLRSAAALKAAGGSVMVIAGDIFHTRGVIDPEVLNPTRSVIEEILEMGISIYAIPGNHDLKSADTQELSSAIQNLAQISLEGTVFKVLNEATVIVEQEAVLGFVPWRWTQEALLEDLEKLSKHTMAKEMDVFIHAGIDGVISGMPAGGLTDAKLASFGFRHVFAGHYHNHHDFGNGVVSIGATTHHNWGDVGTRAGFLLVDSNDGKVTFNDTMAPKFVDISGLDEMEMELESKGNYVRFRGATMTQDQVKELRDQLKAWGALGVSIEVPRATVSARTAAPSKGLTLEQSVEKFVTETKNIAAGVDRAKVAARAQQVLADSKTVFEEA